MELDYSNFNIEKDDFISFDKRESNNNSKFQNGIFIYGLGDYSRVYITPHFKMITKICCVDYNSLLTEYYRKKYNFLHSKLIYKDTFSLVKNTDYPLIIIATYHSDHSRMALELFEKNPNAYIFIEKPPCVTYEDILILKSLFERRANLEIGFNRRYIPYNNLIKEKISGKRVVITMSIKEILINKNHWYLWKNQGTRITGNLVHWIDLSIFWIDSIPITINLLADNSKSDDLALSILFDNGSIVNITVSDEGNSLRGVQEFIEIRFDNETIIIEDYIKFTHIQSDGKKITKRKILRDKGHDQMYKKLMERYKDQQKGSYTLNDLIKTSIITLRASEMFLNGKKSIEIKDEVLNLVGRIS